MYITPKQVFEKVNFLLSETPEKPFPGQIQTSLYVCAKKTTEERFVGRAEGCDGRIRAEGIDGWCTTGGESLYVQASVAKIAPLRNSNYRVITKVVSKNPVIGI